MRTLAHLSDLHFGRIAPAVVEALEADLAQQAPDLVVVSGDLTQRGRHHEFLDARAFLDRLARPVLVVPGNHDVPAYNLMSRFLKPYGRFSRHISADLSPLVSDEHMAVLGLNTARRLVWHWNWALGSLNRAQMAAASATLARGTGPGIRVVVMHHPAVLPPDHRHGRMLFRADQALATFAASRVDVLMSGHLHRTHAAVVPVADPRPGTPAWPMIVAQAASATSTRLREESNGYNILTLEARPPRVRVAPRLWTGRGFESRDVRTFDRQDGHWSVVAG